MLKFSKYKLLIISVLLLTVLINMALFMLNREQASDINTLNEQWNTSVSNTIETALELAKLERALGYVGFIHHFKNYIIRRNESYFDLANAAYIDATDAIALLRKRNLPKTSYDDLTDIESALTDYFTKLNLAKLQWPQLEPLALDKKVQVDDTKANQALIRLRQSLLPNVMQQYNKAINQSELIANHSVNSYVITLFTLGSFAVFLILLLFKREHLLNQLKTVLNSSPDGIIYSDTKGTIISANPAAHSIFGYQPRELRGKSIEDLIEPKLRQGHKKYRKHFSQKLDSRPMGGAITEIRGITKTGDIVVLDVAISSVEIKNEVHSISIIRDISNQKALEFQAQKDYLTQLDNRRSIDLKLREELVRAKRYGRCISVILIDIDNFKQLNDNEGHLVGDQALKAVAHFLETYSRGSDHIGRWGGDEFIMLTPELAKEDAIALAERIRQEFTQHSDTFNNLVTLSLGVSSYCGQTESKSIEAFFEEVDSALFNAKQTGRNKVVSFHQN